ncbi:MAG: helix-turn-helix domain-containing protein [Melioribacteraceae bacterium]|nr:helix-turn-helix domain-containing protein [Melioribacteraceae bacterium]MCF8396466.1 helix-turn-helix domain-containing protein [Melioribacteraceae bacterium]
MISYFDLISAVDITVALLLLLFYRLLNKIQTKSGIYLELCLFLMACIFVFELLVYNRYYSIATYLFVFYYPVFLMIYPLMYIFFKKLTFNLEKEKYIYFVKYSFLSLLLLFINIVYFLPLSYEEKLKVLLTTIDYNIIISKDYGVLHLVYACVYYIQAFIFIFLLIKLVFVLRKKINTNLLNNYLIRYIIIFVAGVIISEISLAILLVFSEYDLWRTKTYEHTISLLYILFLGYIGQKQLLIMIQNRLNSISGQAVYRQNEKLSTFDLSPTEKHFIKENIEKYLSSTRHYLDPNFKMDILSKKLHIPVKKISIVINTLFGKNFRSLINEYRIEEARKLLLKEDSKISVEDVYTSVGFYSRSNFNKVFKELTGLTPKEFKRKIKAAS